MKKKIFIFLVMILGVFLSTGCGKYGEKDVIKDLNNKINKADAYKLDGDLEIVNNDEVYNYNIEVSYKKDNFYKVSLTNINNDHTQIILKNDDGVYVQTHKSTKQNII